MAAQHQAKDLAVRFVDAAIGEIRLTITKFAFYVCLSCTVATSFAQSSVNPLSGAPTSRLSASATTEVERFMADYHQAVASHDGPRVLSMFIDQGGSWFNVLTDAEYARTRVKNPAALKVRHSTSQEFATFVASSHAALDPQHSNVQIHTDGTIASVCFDFIFNVDGKPTNQGSEAWQMVKATDGWKIVAMTYSSDGSRH